MRGSGEVNVLVGQCEGPESQGHLGSWAALAAPCWPVRDGIANGKHRKSEESLEEGFT